MATKTSEKPVKIKPAHKARSAAISIFAMLVWVLVAVVASQFAVGYLMLFILGKDAFVTPVWTAVYSAVSYLVALILIIMVPWKLFKKWKTSRDELGLNELLTWTDIGLAPVGYIVATVLAAILMGIFSAFPWFNAEEAQDVGFSFMVGGGERILAFFTLVIVAPVAEEIIFRGWLYGKIRNRTAVMSGKFSSIIVSSLLVSLLFGLVHFQWNVSVNVFAMSIVLCVMREITGTIYSGVLMHMLKNGIAFWLLYVIGIH